MWLHLNIGIFTDLVKPLILNTTTIFCLDFHNQIYKPSPAKYIYISESLQYLLQSRSHDDNLEKTRHINNYTFQILLVVIRKLSINLLHPPVRKHVLIGGPRTEVNHCVVPLYYRIKHLYQVEKCLLKTCLIWFKPFP